MRIDSFLKFRSRKDNREIHDRERQLTHTFNRKQSFLNKSSGNHFIEIGFDETDRVWINHSVRIAQHRPFGRHPLHAEAGMLGVIPGNMRDGSYIVEGKGKEMKRQKNLIRVLHHVRPLINIKD